MLGPGGEKALVLYWSLTGSTKKVADSVAEGLRDSGAACAVHDLRTAAPPDVLDFDMVGFGYPVHYYRPPQPVIESIRGLDLTGRSVFSFCLHGTYRGAGLNRARDALLRAGGTEIGAFACHGGGGFYPYMRRGWTFSAGHPDEKDLADARSFGASLVSLHAAVRRGETVPLPARDPRTHPMYAIERLAAHPWLARVFYYRFIRAIPERCTRCGLCARLCPAHAITWARGERPVWGPECMLCLNCVTVCPEAAVVCPIDWALFRPFISWNVKRALRDPLLDRAPVALRRGKAVRLDDPESQPQVRS